MLTAGLQTIAIALSAILYRFVVLIRRRTVSSFYPLVHLR